MRIVVLPYKHVYHRYIIQTIEIFSLSQKEESSRIVFMALLKIPTTRIVYLWAALFLVPGIMSATFPSSRAAGLLGATYSYLYFIFSHIFTLINIPVKVM
jgi:hypothetical protein